VVFNQPTVGSVVTGEAAVSRRAFKTSMGFIRCMDGSTDLMESRTKVNGSIFYTFLP